MKSIRVYGASWADCMTNCLMARGWVVPCDWSRSFKCVASWYFHCNFFIRIRTDAS